MIRKVDPTPPNADCDCEGIVDYGIEGNKPAPVIAA